MDHVATDATAWSSNWPYNSVFCSHKNKRTRKVYFQKAFQSMHFYMHFTFMILYIMKTHSHQMMHGTLLKHVFFYSCEIFREKNPEKEFNMADHNFNANETVATVTPLWFCKNKTNTARKVSKNGVFSGPYFPVFSSNTGKYVPGKTPYLDTYHSVKYLESWFKSDRRNGRLIIFLLGRLFLNLYQKRKVL